KAKYLCFSPSRLPSDSRQREATYQSKPKPLAVRKKARGTLSCGTGRYRTLSEVMRMFYDKDTRTGYPVRGTADRAHAVLFRTAATTNKSTYYRPNTFAGPIGQLGRATCSLSGSNSRPGTRRIHVSARSRESGTVASTTLHAEWQGIGRRGC